MVESFKILYNFMAPACPSKLDDACNKYFMRICGTTTAENTLLKVNYLFMKDAHGILKVILNLAVTYVLQYTFEEHITFSVILSFWC